MTRNPLLQNYLPPQTLLEGFEDFSEWTIVNGEAESSIDHVLQGSNSLKITSASDIVSRVQKSISTLRLRQPFLIRFYLDGDPYDVLQLDAGIMLQFSTGSAFTNFATYSFVNNRLKQGWNTYYIHPSQISYEGTARSYSKYTYLRLRIDACATGTANIYFDSLYTLEYKPMSYGMINFDNGYESVYTLAYPVLSALGIKATVYINSDFIGNEEHMTLSQLQELYGAGWTIGNHTTDHTNLAALATEAAIIEKIQPCTDYLILNGMPRGAKHLAYPYTNSPTALTRTVMTNLGILTGRDAATSLYYFQNFDFYKLNNFYIQPYNSPDTVMSWVNLGIARGGGVNLLFHRIVESGANGELEYNLDNFVTIINRLYASKIKLLTIDEWYIGLYNPRYCTILPNRQ